MTFVVRQTQVVVVAVHIIALRLSEKAAWSSDIYS